MDDDQHGVTGILWHPEETLVAQHGVTGILWHPEETLVAQHGVDDDPPRVHKTTKLKVQQK